MALADAGDGLEDANFAPETANKLILRLTKEEAWIEEMLALVAAKKLRTGPQSFWDKVFANEINVAIRDTDEGVLLCVLLLTAVSFACSIPCAPVPQRDQGLLLRPRQRARRVPPRGH